MDKNSAETGNCVFCRIAAKTIPSDMVYEDEQTFAFLDINPSNKGHILVVPKEHYADIFATPGDILCAVASTGKRVAEVLKKLTKAEGVNLIMNNGEAAGQIVFHTHLHVLPRFKGDELFAKPKRTSYDDGESARTAEEIRNALKK